MPKTNAKTKPAGSAPPRKPPKKTRKATGASSRDHRVRIDGVLYRYRDAAEDVVVTRTLEDVLKGQVGKPGACMNAVCMLRLHGEFPHPVLAVSVQRSVIYVLESLNMAVRYFVSPKETALIDMHDDAGIGATGDIRLRAPRGVKQKGQSQSHPPQNQKKRPQGRDTGTKGKNLSKGERARLAKSGELYPLVGALGHAA